MGWHIILILKLFTKLNMSANQSKFLAILLLTNVVLLGLNISIVCELIQTKYKKQFESYDKHSQMEYRWCKTGEDSKKDNCVDGSGSGGYV